MNEIPIFCINLERACERKQKIQKEWIETLKFDIQFWQAYDRRSLSYYSPPYPYDKNIAKHIFERELSDGEVACTISFFLLFQHIIDNNIEEAIIIEDDAIPLINNKQTVYDAIQNTKIEFPDIQIIYMHDLHPKQKEKQNCNKHNIYYYENIFNIRKHTASLSKLSPWGNQCFLIKQSAILTMFDNIEKNNGRPIIYFPADHFANYTKLCDKNIVGILNEPICTHDWMGSESTTYIGNELRKTNRKFIE